MPSTIAIGPGAGAVEEALLDAVRDLCAETRSDPRTLAKPVRIVVPSGSLRLHVSARLVRELGAVAGIAVQTLHAVAAEILERAGIEAHGGDELVAVLARRLAADEPDLQSVFEPFQDGYRPAAATVRDLLDAGFEPALHEAVLERLEEISLSSAKRARARAVIRVARAVSERFAETGSGGRAELLRSAREAFLADPDGTLPTRRLIVHGFADATGSASELLEALVKRLSGSVLIDHPRDPDRAASGERPDPGVVFTERLIGRLEGALGKAEVLSDERTASDVAFFRAPGAEAEAREVARRVRAHIDAGTAPEEIAIVARDLGPYRAALRVQLGRLAIPFSGLRARAPLDGRGRRIHALIEVLTLLEQSSTDRWLDAAQRLTFDQDGKPVKHAPNGELRLALRILGAARLADTAALTPEEHLDAKGRLHLPIRYRIARVEPGAESERDRRYGSFFAPRVHLDGARLRGAVAAAGKLVRRLKRWPQRASLSRHLAELAKLRRVDLGWQDADPAEQRVARALTRLERSFPEEELSSGELALLVSRTLLPVAAPELGGEGGGVQVLDAMEARARTFAHLYLIGMNRDVFPRVIGEDPLFPDDVRGALAVLLPDVPIKARGRDEDRYLFAQLLSASPRVTLSWQLADDDGKPRIVSPLVERLLGESDPDDVPAAAPLYPQDAERAFEDELRPAREHAVLSGLHNRLTGLEPRLVLALGDSELAATRFRVLSSFENGPFLPEALGPWLGFLGPLEEVGVRPDPRADPLYVTRFEGMARCPWQIVLAKLLRLEDAADPLDTLPGIEPRVIGNIVHRVLEELARDALGSVEAGLDEVLQRDPVRVEWPAPERLEALLLQVAHEEIRKEHTPLPGLVRMLAECARPYLERAREIFAEEAKRSEGVLGVEVFGRARVPRGDDAIEILFRADSVDRLDDTVVLTDFKTGKAVSTKKLRSGMRSGQNLQPMVYVLGGLDSKQAVMGRYLYLKPELADQEADVRLGERYADYLTDFVGALGSIVDAWVTGAFFPRLYDPTRDKEPDACRFCDVSQACLRRDSGARRALTTLAGRSPSDDDDETLHAMRALWSLGQEEGKRS